MYTNVFKIILWMIINISGIIIAKYFINKPIKCLPILRPYFKLNNNNEIIITHKKKNPLEEVSDNESLIKLALIQFYFANIYIKMNSFYKLFYLIPMYGTIVLFGLAGEIKELQFSLSTNSIKNWSLAFKVLIFLFTIFFITLLFFNINYAYLQNLLFPYILSILLIITFYFTMFQIYLKNKNYPIHLHHWFLGYILSFFFLFDNWWNNLTYSILYGIFIEGLVYYGPTSIFKN